MTAYEFILTIDKELLQVLHNKKMVRFSIFIDIEMYEFYLNEKKKHTCMEARTNTSDKFCTSEETVSRMLFRMRKDIKLK
jgi:hypothetical protein